MSASKKENTQVLLRIIKVRVCCACAQHHTHALSSLISCKTVNSLTLDYRADSLLERGEKGSRCVMRKPSESDSGQGRRGQDERQQKQEGGKGGRETSGERREEGRRERVSPQNKFRHRLLRRAQQFRFIHLPRILFVSFIFSGSRVVQRLHCFQRTFRTPMVTSHPTHTSTLSATLPSTGH